MSRVNPRPIYWDSTGEKIVHLDVNGQYSDVSSPGGLGYLVYTALLSQSGTDAPDVDALANTIGMDEVWVRDGAGTYYASSTTNYVQDKVWAAPFSYPTHNKNTVMPIQVEGVIAGYYSFYVFDSDGKVGVELDVYDIDFNNVDLSELLGEAASGFFPYLSLPELRVYP